MSTTETEVERVARKNAEWIRDAREMIDFIESRPELIEGFSRIHLSSYVFGQGETAEEQKKDAKRQTRNLVKRLGECNKNWYSYALEVTKKFGSHEITISVSRDSICERKVVGTTHVPERIIEAHEEEVVEWVCEDPSILRAIS